MRGSYFKSLRVALYSQQHQPGKSHFILVLSLPWLTQNRSQFSFASLGLENAVVTDAALARDFLAVISHTGSKFQLHVIKLNIETLQVELLYTIPFNQGEVTAFSLCEIAEKIYAVTCLALGKAVFLDVYCITHQERITSVSLNDCKHMYPPPPYHFLSLY